MRILSSRIVPGPALSGWKVVAVSPTGSNLAALSSATDDGLAEMNTNSWPGSVLVIINGALRKESCPLPKEDTG